MGLPLVVSTLCYSVMQFCDRLFLAWHDELEMAAVMPAVVLNWTATSLPLGIASYATTFVAQYSGSKRERKIGAIIWTACWLGVFFLPLFILLSWSAESIFILFQHPADLLSLEATYFRIACFGSAAIVFEAALSSFFIGRGKTRVVMVINLIALLLNLVLDWVLIFGYGPIPEMGIAGAAWATTISVSLKSGIYLGLILRRPYIRRFGLNRGFWLKKHLMGRLLKYGGPSGWQMWTEGMAISVFVLYIGRIGVVEAAATTLALSVNMIAFIPLVGLGMSVTTLVGQRIGSGELQLARRAVFFGMVIGMVYSLFFAVLYLFTPGLFLWAHEMAESGENFPEIESTTIFLLKFVASYCIFDCIQIIYISALKGAGDTRFIFLATVVNSTLFVGIGLLGVRLVEPRLELTWWWIIITSWLLMYALIFFFRYRQGKWMRMSVISEPGSPQGPETQSS